MSPDSFNQYHDAKFGEYSDWHPVLMAWLWSRFDSVYPGPAPMLLLHLVLYWSSWLLISLASRRWLRYGALLVPLLGFWPGLAYPLGQIWKDIAFATTMFFAWAYLLYVYAERRKLGWRGLGLVLLLSVYAVGVKTNGLVVLPFLFAFAAYLLADRNIRWKRVLALSIAMPILTLVAVSGIASRLKVIKTSPFQYTQTYDLLALSVKTGEVLLPEYITKKVGNTPDKLQPLYWVGGNNVLFYGAAGTMTTLDPGELADLRHRWQAALRKHPAQYWEHRWANFKELMRWRAATPAYIANPRIDDNQYGFSFSKNPFSNWLSSAPEKHPGMFFPWIYVGGLLFSSLALFAAAREHRFLVACVCASAIAFTLPHIFIAPASDYRYLYYVYFCSVAVVFFLLAAAAKRLLSGTSYLRRPE